MQIENNVLLRVESYEIADGTFLVPDDITSIGNNAFADCRGLTSIILPKSITSIGNYAFDCSGLTSITLSDGMTSIGVGAFLECRGLTSITLPDSMTSIGHVAFAYCSDLISISIIANTSEDFERIKLLLPEDLRPKAHDVINDLRVEIDTFEQHIINILATDGKLDENGLTTIKQLQAKLDRLIGKPMHEPMQQKMNDILTTKMMWLVENNQLQEAVIFINKTNLSNNMAFELASALLGSSEHLIEVYPFILHLFKNHDEDEGVRMLLERSALNILSRLFREKPASLTDKLADYNIERCLPCSSILNTIRSIQGLDKDLRELLLNTAEFLLPHELRQLIDTAPLKDAFIEQYGPTNLVTYESILLLSSKKEVDAICQYQQNPHDNVAIDHNMTRGELAQWLCSLANTEKRPNQQIDQYTLLKAKIESEIERLAKKTRHKASKKTERLINAYISAVEKLKTDPSLASLNNKEKAAQLLLAITPQLKINTRFNIREATSYTEVYQTAIELGIVKGNQSRFSFFPFSNQKQPDLSNTSKFSLLKT